MRTYKRKEKPWNEVTMKAALQHIAKTGLSIRKTATKFNISITTLSRRCLEEHGTLQRKSQGRKTAISPDVEKYIAESIGKMSKCGFGPSLLELSQIVSEFLDLKKIETIFDKNKPGYEWSKSFMNRHHLKRRKGGQMQIARKSNEHHMKIKRKSNEIRTTI